MSFRSLWESVRRVGPYLLIELILPGGTLVALLLWFSNTASRGQFADEQQVAEVPVAIAQTTDVDTAPPELPIF